jgi:hypothetical protein
MHYLLPSQLSESCHVDVPESLVQMLHPLIATPMHHQACLLRKLLMEMVQAVHLPLYLRQQ